MASGQAAVGGPGGRCGILDEEQAVAVRHRPHLLEMRRLSVLIDGDHPDRPGSHERLDGIGVHQAGVGEHVGEPGCGTAEEDSMGGRGIRVVGHDHLVARRHTQREQGQVERRGAVRQGEGMRRAHQFGERRLQLTGRRALTGQPAGCQDALHRDQFRLTGGRLAEAYLLIHG